MAKNEKISAGKFRNVEVQYWLLSRKKRSAQGYERKFEDLDNPRKLGIEGAALQKIEVPMPVSRRKFLQNGAVAAAVLATAPLPAWSGAQPSSADVNPASHSLGTVHGVDRASFERAVGSAFQVSTGQANSQPVWLTLLKVEDPPALLPVNPGMWAVPPPKSNSTTLTSGFVLTFQSSAPPLGQGTYTFRHEALGEFRLFIVPGTTGTYVAVFNLLVASATSGLTPPRLAPPRPKGLGWRADNAGSPSSSAVGGSSPSAVSNTSGSSGGRPAQEQQEPVFRNRPEPKLPE